MNQIRVLQYQYQQEGGGRKGGKEEEEGRRVQRRDGGSKRQEQPMAAVRNHEDQVPRCLSQVKFRGKISFKVECSNLCF